MPPAGRGGYRQQRDDRDDRDDDARDDQEPEEEERTLPRKGDLEKDEAKLQIVVKDVGSSRNVGPSTSLLLASKTSASRIGGPNGEQNQIKIAVVTETGIRMIVGPQAAVPEPRLTTGMEVDGLITHGSGRIGAPTMRIDALRDDGMIAHELTEKMLPLAGLSSNGILEKKLPEGGLIGRGRHKMMLPIARSSAARPEHRDVHRPLLAVPRNEVNGGRPTTGPQLRRAAFPPPCRVARPRKAQVAKQEERWQLLRDNLRKLRQNGATEHMESFFGRGHYGKKHDSFHKEVKLPSYGNWNWASFAHLLCGELYGTQETSKEGTYGAAIEGWVGTVHAEEDPEFRAMYTWIVESMDTWVDLLSEIPSQMHDIMGWKITEPEVDRLLRHFYPGAWHQQEVPSSSSHQDREVIHSTPAQNVDHQNNGDDYYYEDDDEEDEEEEEDQYWGRAGADQDDTRQGYVKDEYDPASLEALGIYEEVPETPAPETGPAHSTLTEPSGSLEQAPTFTPYSFAFPPTRLSHKRDETLSKRLSKVLRHDKGEFGLTFHKNATASLESITRLDIFAQVGATIEELAVIYWNKKQRFRILYARENGVSRIVAGAVQGHSREVDPEAVHDRVDPKEVPYLLHATHYEFYKKIYNEGLHPGGGGGSSWRQQLHLLPDEKGSEKYFPTRTDIVLHVTPSSATESVYYRSQNGYYLTSDPIAPKFIQAVTIRESGERVESTDDSPPLPSVVLQAYLRPHLGKAGQQMAPDNSNSEQDLDKTLTINLLAKEFPDVDSDCDDILEWRDDPTGRTAPTEDDMHHDLAATLPMELPSDYRMEDDVGLYMHTVSDAPAASGITTNELKEYLATAQSDVICLQVARSLTGIPLRATLIVAGDFQAEVSPEALDPDALGMFMESNGLVALNTWHGAAKPTQFNQAPQNQVGTSQIDYIMTRTVTADPRAKFVKVAKPPIGTWRLHIGHYSLATDIRIMNHYLLPTRRPAQPAYNKKELDEAVRKGTEQARALELEIKTRVELLPQDSPHLNQAIMQATVRYRMAAKKAQKQCYADKRQATLDLLGQAEAAATSGDQRKVYQVVKQLAPWAPRNRVMLKDDQGTLLTQKQEHDSLVSYSRGLFAPPQEQPRREGVILPLIFTLEEVYGQLRITSVGKAATVLAALIKERLYAVIRRLGAPDDLIAAVIALHDTSSYHLQDDFYETKVTSINWRLFLHRCSKSWLSLDSM
ncbi:kptA [Symbiodinium sp. CCMP2592]|nr:kptA [Symbiodinium sp. CCMP2592]